MLSILLAILTISTTESVYPTAILIDESNDQNWTPLKIDRTDWTATADSEQTTDQVNEGPISNILTSDPNKIWLTKINENGNGRHDDRPNKIGPFRFTINLNKRTTFKAFSLKPRQTGDQGKIKLYEFYAALSENELNMMVQNGQYLSKGTIDPNEVKSTLVILPSSVTAKFVAVLSLNNHEVASCAEFNLYSDEGQSESKILQIVFDESRDKFWSTYKIDRSGWTATANSENNVNNNDGPASFMIDGNTATHWHTSYNSGHNERPSESDPYIATIDLGQETTFKAFSYMPRQDATNGRFQHYEFYVAQTRDQLDTKIQNKEYEAKGDIDSSLTNSTLVIFRTVLTGQFVALASIEPGKHATCAEFNLYRDSPDLPGFYSQLMVNEITDFSWDSYKVDRSGWNVTANSENVPNGNDGPASFMIDGNTNTMWHSKYGGGHDERVYLYIATFDLGQETTFEAFSYMPRQAGDPNGKFKFYEFYSAQSREELLNKIDQANYTAKGMIDRDSKLSTFVIFEKSITARFVGLVSIPNDRFCTCAEFNLYNGIPTIPFPSPPPVPVQVTTKAIINQATDTFWNQFVIDRTGWKVRANTEEILVHSNGDGPIEHILDGKSNTWWHTKYENGRDDRHTDEKFHFTIDLGKITTFNALAYRPRVGDTGRFKRFEFYTANTTEELFVKLQNRNYIVNSDVDSSLSSSTFIIFKEQQIASHIAVLVTDFVYSHATCAEFNLYTEPTPFEVDQSAMTNQEGLINITCDKFTYENWASNGQCVSSGTADHGSFVNTIGAKAKITFFGVKAHLLVRKENTNGIIYVRIDDVVTAIVDVKAYSGGAVDTIVYTSNDLEYGQHTFEIESLSTATIVLGSVYIDPLPKQNSYILGFSDFTQIDGEWTEDSSSKPPVFSSESDTASGSFVFYGTRFYLTGVRGNNMGNMKISIDDGEFIAINEKKDPAVAQNNKAIKLYDSGDIDFKLHTVKIQHTDSKISLMNLLYTWYPNNETPAPTQSPTESATESATESPTPETATSTPETATSTPETATQTPETATQTPETATQTPETATQTPETATQTPETATQTPETATQTPETATQTPETATPETPTTATPTPIVEDIVYEESNYTESIPDRNRIEKEINKSENTNIAIVVKKSEFVGNTNDNGGAIHIVNCGIKTDGNTFRECKSEKGAGGAIFVENTHALQNDVHFINLKIIDCSAEYGGGAYIYSDSIKNIIEIRGCTFENNVATKSDSENNLCGGGAIFLNVITSYVRKCKFYNNDVKIYNENEPSSSSMILESSKSSSIVITECNFKIANNMKYSIFYYAGNVASTMKLENCNFYGLLNNNAYFIDGKLTNKKSPKMIIKSSRFASSYNKALNQNAQFASIDLKDQLFEVDQFKGSSEKEFNIKSILLISVSAMTVVVVLIVLLVIIVKKSTNPNVYSNANDGIELSSQSTDTSLNSLVTPLI